MADFVSENQLKMVKRLNATLPNKLAEFVGQVTGEDGLYETPSEFVRDLIRRYMEKTYQAEKQEINQLLKQSVEENEYNLLTTNHAKDIRQIIDD